MTVSLSESKQNGIKTILKEVKIRGKVGISIPAKVIEKLEAASRHTTWQTLFMAFTSVKKHSFEESWRKL